MVKIGFSVHSRYSGCLYCVFNCLCNVSSCASLQATWPCLIHSWPSWLCPWLCHFDVQAISHGDSILVRPDTGADV